MALSELDSSQLPPYSTQFLNKHMDREISYFQNNVIPTLDMICVSDSISEKMTNHKNQMPNEHKEMTNVIIQL
ncbi:hypothetical protein GIB67_019096 [Kingdonia uniflora]|uniref:Uncharacterized protein n=1 Tax=Kingdonia uniflora TaxID=39325 RepID=A0A7J7MZR3_9MAGN|nr:hypothetical protein GIB67_019096 [Kingdonia uniflora]